MSTTSIYALTKTSCVCLGQAGTAWSGPVYLWNVIARNYFGQEQFPSGWNDAKLRVKIWRSVETHPLSLAETVLLMTTFDYAVVDVDHVPELISLMRKFADEHPMSSFAQQADLLAAAVLPSGGVIAWHQADLIPFRFPVQEGGKTVDLSSSWDVFKRLRFVSQQRLLKK